MILLLNTLLSCNTLNEVACRHSTERMHAIQEQQHALGELYSSDQLSKKKYNYFNSILSKEVILEQQKIKRSCFNETQ